MERDDQKLLKGLRRCREYAAEELIKMSTYQLMKIRKIMLSLEESPHENDFSGKSYWSNSILVAIENSKDIFFKDDNRWVHQYDNLKKALKDREHVPNKEQRRKLRQEKAKK